MTILLVMIPITLLLVVAGGFAFFWAVNHDQFDDMDSPSLQPLTDSDAAAPAADGRHGGKAARRDD
ncbi:MAG: cbb3-type cytochrome oxidase assembly protein CcoS [Lautropia sp.]